ncbi:MAG: peroxiredoxin family protein, partial [Chloroflexi bacterium]|nr:peroxiredoxin family protein [Chloroflexota bacterium]
MNDQVYTRDSLRGKTVVLFFTEGLMCFPACWNQIVAFERDARFKDGDTIALSIVVDAKQEWKDAANKMPELGQVTVLFDRLAAVSTRYGVLRAKSSMHPGTMPL